MKRTRARYCEAYSVDDGYASRMQKMHMHINVHIGLQWKYIELSDRVNKRYMGAHAWLDRSRLYKTAAY